MKRNLLGLTLALGALFGATGSTRSAADAPRRRPPVLRRWKSIDRITRTKQCDQQAKLERRKQRQANDGQLWARQKAKWG